MWKCIGLFTIMIMLLFLPNHVISSPSAAATTHLSPNMQKLALYQFRLSMSIDAYAAACNSGSISKMMNWSMSSDCCTWGGVTCNQKTGDVIGLDLRCSQLVGAIYSNNTLFHLSLLQFWGSSSNLQALYLEQTTLSGGIPDSIGYLKSLILLSLPDCKIDGTIPKSIGNLIQLTKLDLSSNNLTGLIPESLVFTCSNNLINGSIPESFLKLVSLTTLDFSSNNFSGVLDIEIFARLEYLETLVLSYNSLSLRVTSTTMLPPQIMTLGLSSCKIKEFTHFLGTAENLKYLDLSNNQIHGEIPQGIGMGKFYNLDLSGNFLTCGIENLSWDFLEYLNLQPNILNGSLPDSICNSTSLNVLNLSHNNLSGVLPACSRSLDYTLSVLDVRMNSIRGSIPSTLSNFRKLRSLNLYANKLEGTIPRSFAEFDYLEVFDLGSNQIKDTFPQWLEALQNLQVLSLKSNKLHGIINNVSKVEIPFPSLRIIDLSDNEFSGPLPAKYIENFKRSYMGDSYYSDTVTMVIKGVTFDFVRILTTFTTIDLSRNNFEGQIPELIGNLESLRYLNLSHNHLSGRMPSLVGKLSVLESLDLSFNRLVGFIPQELTGLFFLSRLNLSYNDLNGHIPEGAQFGTFETDSYIGNLALCGRPLSKRCDREITETQENADEDDDYFFMLG
ncbi:receptor-like protein 33 [Apium graveolens]|uniref:receptor-like protein 33 n=1 Tax=Apium graveolens TaxID=4045 RepID=UPI003D79B678